MSKKSRKSATKGILGNLKADMTQGVGLITLGALTPKIPSAGLGAWGNVMAGQEIQSLSSIARGSKVTLDAVTDLSNIETKSKSKSKKKYRLI